MSQMWQGHLRHIQVQKNGKEVPSRKAVAALIRIYGNCILYFYKVCCISKKNQILQRCISGPDWKPGSGEGNDSQGQWGGALGEISYNRWYLAKSEAISCCWDAAVAQGFALTVIKPSSFCLVSPSSLWDLNDVTMVVVVAQHIIELSIFMLQSQHVVQANQKSEHCNLALN